MPDTLSVGTGATEALARFAAWVDYETLPDAARSRLKECFLDFVGIAAFAAARVETSPIFRAGVQTVAPRSGPATVIGEPRGYPAPYAALLNGTYAHTLDFDDTNLFGSLHPGAPVIPAAMAVAEQVGASGPAFIEALAAGYEVVCRVGAALGPTAYDRGFHITSVAGIFGAVAAAARLRRLDAAIIANAFGLAASKAAGSMQYLDNGAWNKRLHPGFAAHDAILSLALAEAGVKGATAAIEGRYGLLNGYSNAPNPGALTQDLGTRWVLVETAIKPYPSCRLTHGAVDAALALRERVAPEQRAGASLDIRLSPKAVQIVGERMHNKLHPQNIVDAQFSVYFQVAAAWLHGRCDWQSYDRLRDADMAALAGRMSVEADPAMPLAGASLAVRGAGEAFAERVDQPLGEPERPIPWERVEGKFTGLAETVYGAARARAIARRIRGLENEVSAARLIRGLRTRRPR